MDLTMLRAAEDNGANAVKDLSQTSKWAAMQVLARDLDIRITQVDLDKKKVEAFKKETGAK